MRAYLRLVALPLCLFVSAAVAADELGRQRELFSDAYRKLTSGQPVDLDTLRRKLDGYVLAPYLDYAALRRNLGRASPERVTRFLEQHSDLPVADALRAEYLGLLGRGARWELFNRLYRDGMGAELHCYQLQARRADGKVDAQWLAQARDLWLVGRSQPAACDPVFAELAARGELGTRQRWERALLALDAGEFGLANHLAKELPLPQRSWISHWQRMHAQPRAALKAPGFALEGETAAQLVGHGLRRLARAEPEEALELLEKFARGDLFTPLALAELRRDIALRMAYSQDPAALAKLDALPDEVVTEEVRLWRARLALRAQNWPRLLEASQALPEPARSDEQWRFWRAYALEALGQREAARPILEGLALERNYYGFLAADLLNRPYNLNHVATQFSAEDIARVAAEPGLRRAEEFYRIGLMSDARREWQAAVARLPTEDKGRAAVLALNWGWYDRAIFTANSAGLNDALHLRFPTPYRDRVEYHSRKHRLDPSLTYAFLRKESAFRADAVSPAGALGLMQVMPQTGKLVARQLKERAPTRNAMLEVDTSLKLGSAYLRSMLDKYDGNLMLAAAAYNAGPHRVKDWMARSPELPPALWVEAISFSETRDYVKSILAFRAVFDWQLNGEVGENRRITEYMLPRGAAQVDACGATEVVLGSCQASRM